MRYEFDHRTGSMQPKKDDNIYFAQSQGGGLIVDDKKNNIRYIIERDDRITKLFGGFDGDSLNFYDMRDARMIADRVVRLLGRNHKYSDFHYFLKGYHMSENFVRSFSGFLDESVWSDIHRRSNGDVRKEEAREVGVLPDGTKLILPNEAFADGGSLVGFFDDANDEDCNYYNLIKDVYVSVITVSGTDTYYRYDPDTDEKINMVKCFEADDSLRNENEFGALKAVLKTCDSEDYVIGPEDLDDLEINIYGSHTIINLSHNIEYFVFDDYDDAVKYAVDSVTDYLDGSLSRDEIKRYYDIFGNDVFNVDAMRSDLKDSYYTYFDDMDDNEIIDELLRLGIIEDTDEYFGTDEDGDIDHDLPSFDINDYRDEYVDKTMDNINDIVGEYIMQYGYDFIESYIDVDKLAKLIVDSDGPENTIASYDSVEREEKIGDVTYYIYRTN